VEACPEARARKRSHVAGEVLAKKYRLEEPLGEGGQAAVWRATNLVLDAAVAVKLFKGGTDKPGGTEASEEQAARLWDEARTIARLRHPAIVRVFDVDRTLDGDPFVVMELLEGQTLRDLLEARGRIDAREAVQLLLPIADALAAAHAQDLVHRDVKPENIFLCRSDDGSLRPKLLDFGAVRLPSKDAWKRTTADGYLVGTPGYLAPEQILREGELDGRADVWGLCVTLYELLTGRTPFDGPTIQQLLRSAVTDEVTPVAEFAPCDPRLWRIIARGLAKQRSERWSSAAEFGSALAQWLSDNGVLDDIAGVLLERRWLVSSSRVPASGDGSVSHAVVVPKSYSRQRGRSLFVALASAAVLLGAGVWTLAAPIGAPLTGTRPEPASAERPAPQPFALDVAAHSDTLVAAAARPQAEPERPNALPAPATTTAAQAFEPTANRQPAPSRRARSTPSPRAMTSKAVATSAAPSTPAPERTKAADLIDPY
jgi:serine/threonine-protein kinase